jgi:hypothetical protein
VSTDRQGQSGLGLDAQQEAVVRFVGGVGNLAAEFTEIESGKKHTNRPQLAAALAASKKQGATLVIAKLDRLARNVHFISGLMESKGDFVAVDMPQANRLTVHIMAAFAEHEREQIKLAHEPKRHCSKRNYAGRNSATRDWTRPARMRRTRIAKSFRLPRWHLSRRCEARAKRCGRSLRN